MEFITSQFFNTYMLISKMLVSNIEIVKIRWDLPSAVLSCLQQGLFMVSSIHSASQLVFF